MTATEMPALKPAELVTESSFGAAEGVMIDDVAAAAGALSIDVLGAPEGVDAAVVVFPLLE